MPKCLLCHYAPLFRQRCAAYKKWVWSLWAALLASRLVGECCRLLDTTMARIKLRKYGKTI